MENAPSMELPLDTQLLLALLDLKTERLIAEADAIVIFNANREAAEVSLQDARDRSTM